MLDANSIRVLVALLACALFSMTAVHAQTTWHVDDDAPLGGDGRTWPTAFRHLQDALWVATGGDEVRVAGGIYKPDQDEAGNVTPGDREATFQLINGVGLYGGCAGLADPNDPDARDLRLYESVLTGDIGTAGENSDNCFHVVVSSGTDATAVLDGFTTTAGLANRTVWPHYCGGGLLVENGSPTVRNCKLCGSSAVYGAGMYNYQSCPTVQGCTLSANWAMDGGGLYNYDSHPTIVGCTFHGNSANVVGCGGGVCNWENSRPTFVHCMFSENWAITGGGVYNGSQSAPTLANCTFAENWAYHGGGMYNYESDPTLVNCTFDGNSGDRAGGGIKNNSSNPILSDCTFARNSASNGAALACDSYQQQHPSNVEMTNCILWDGGDEVLNNDGSTIIIAYANVQGGYPGAGNIDVDPLFVDPNNGDVHLSAGSPCIDAGCNWAVPPDVADLDGDGDTEEITPLDLDGEGRFFDDPNTADTGCGVAPIVDMGAYEFGGTGPQPCFGDFNGDRIVDLTDLATLLAYYGETEVCEGDLDCDGDVDTSDLEALLAVYRTTCP